MLALRKLLGFSVFGLIVSFVNPVLATQWVYVGESGNQSHYVDFDSVRGTGSTRTFWIRVNNTYGGTDEISQLTVNCAARQGGVLRVIGYFPNGSVNPYRSFEPPYLRMREIVPGTVFDAYARFICSRIAQTPNTVTAGRSTERDYPKNACGDAIPPRGTSYRLYPVFAEYSPETLRDIRNRLCRDAFQTTRENGRLAIQVASFTSERRASDFADLLRYEVGDGEVGQPTLFNAP